MKRKRQLLVFVLLFTVVFGIVGYKKGVSTTTPSKAQEIKIQNYKNTITDYDETISELNHSIELAQKQIDQLQDYVDNSIYMKLNSQKIYASSAQFAIINTTNTGNILTSFTSFINEGSLLQDLSKEYGNTDSKYLKELIICSAGSNILNITVYHYEEGQNQKLMGLIEDSINRQASVIAMTQGEFKIQKISSSDYTKVDINVANIQNNNMNNLKSLLSNKVDLENKRISQENNKSLYIEKNESKITGLYQINPLKEGIKFAITGSVFGILLLWCIFSIRFILGSYLKSKEDLLSANLPVIATYSPKNGYFPSLDRVILDIQLWVEQYELAGVFVSALSEDKLAKEIVQEYTEKIGQLGVEVDTGYRVTYDAKELRSMINAKYSIVIVQAGKTAYSQISEQIEVCKKFGVKILGYVVIE